MAGTTLGTAYVQIVPSAQGIKGSISNVLSGEAQSAGMSIGGKIGAFAKKAIIAAGIGTVAVKGIKAAMSQGAELEQNIGGAYAVFGDRLYGTLEKQAAQAYKNMGMSASDYYATANKMGSLFQGSGISQTKSLDLTADAMQRAADVASVMGLDTSAAMESIAGAAKGNFTMMDNLGVAMNATTLEAYALEKGMNFKWNTASNAEKAELAMKMFMDRTSQYAGNFARESSETFSGSLGAMKASYQDFLGSLALGEGVEKSMGQLIDTASTFFFKNFIPMLGKIAKSLPKALITLIKKGFPALVKGIVSLIKNLTKSIEGFADGVTSKGVSTWAKKNVPRILAAGAKLMLTLVKAIIINVPKIVAAVGKIALAILTGLGAPLWNKLKAIFAAGWNAVKTVTSTALTAIKTRISTAFTAIRAFVATIWSRIKTAITTPISSAKSSVAKTVDGIKSKVSGAFSGIAGKVKSAFNAVKEAITGPIQAAKETVSGIISKIKGMFPLNLGKIFNLKLPHFKITSYGSFPWGVAGKGSPPEWTVDWYAKGGIFNSPTVLSGIGLGEAGPEAILPLNPFWKRMDEIANNVSGGNTVNIYINGSDKDPKAIAEEVKRVLIKETNQRRLAWQ